MALSKVGEVVRTAQGLAIVRCADRDHPRMGAATVDEHLDDVGRVVDVFGPVERPYLAVSPDDERRLATLLGQSLYVR